MVYVIEQANKEIKMTVSELIVCIIISVLVLIEIGADYMCRVVLREIKENEDDQSNRSVKISCTVIRTFRLMLLCITALASTGVWFLYTGLVQR